jgi:hypothetical protein
MEILNSEEWRLKSLTIEFQEWGDYKGKYLGKIQFANGQKDAFSFTIPDDKCEGYLALIQESVVQSANRLGDKVVNSLRGLSTPKQPQLVEDITHEA